MATAKKRAAAKIDKADKTAETRQAETESTLEENKKQKMKKENPEESHQ